MWHGNKSKHQRTTTSVQNQDSLQRGSKVHRLGEFLVQLSSIRMIYQHTLAEETGLKTRAFTNVLQIKGIEKGSIIIDMFHNLQSIDFCGIIDNVLRAWELSHILQLIINSNNLPENKQMFIERFKSAIRNFIKVDFESTTETTTVRVNKNGEMEIKTKTKRITVNNN